MSKSIKSVGYNTEKEILAVRFKFAPDTLYAYKGVPSEVYEQFKNSQSKGAFMNQVIKPNYKCKAIDRPL